MSDIADRVKKIVVEHLGVEGDKVTESASFIDDFRVANRIEPYPRNADAGVFARPTGLGKRYS